MDITSDKNMSNKTCKKTSVSYIALNVMSMFNNTDQQRESLQCLTVTQV